MISEINTIKMRDDHGSISYFLHRDNKTHVICYFLALMNSPFLMIFETKIKSHVDIRRHDIKLFRSSSNKEAHIAPLRIMSKYEIEKSVVENIS